MDSPTAIRDLFAGSQYARKVLLGVGWYDPPRTFWNACKDPRTKAYVESQIDTQPCSTHYREGYLTIIGKIN